MDTLLWFALWAGLFFLMMRFGCGAHVMGHGHGQHGAQDSDASGAHDGMRWVAPATEIDPVCHKTVNTDTAKSAVYAGTVYYFCSSEHRELFEAAPERYVVAKTGQQESHMEHSHG